MVAEGDRGLTMAANAVQAAFPSLEVSLEVKPKAQLQYGHVAQLRCSGGELGNEQHYLGELLVEHLLVESDLDACFALDYHQERDADGGLQRTTVGEELYQAKYRTLKTARISLTECASKFIERHPLYRNADRITYVPPHTTQPKSSVAERIARGLADSTGRSLIQLLRVVDRNPQKDLDDDDRDTEIALRRKNQHRSMRCDEDLTNLGVIVLDDLLETGASLEEAARALRAAGAKPVLGLAMTKTRKHARVA